jgi:hypothetical protein
MVILLGGAKSFFHLMISVSVAAALAGAFPAARRAADGHGFYLLGIPLGLLIGLICSYASLRAVRAAGPRCARLLFAGTVIWVIVSASIGYEITRLALGAVS